MTRWPWVSLALSGVDLILGLLGVFQLEMVVQSVQGPVECLDGSDDRPKFGCLLGPQYLAIEAAWAYSMRLNLTIEAL